MRVTSFKGVNGGERGASILVFTLMTWLVVIPMVGLAIDGAIVFFAQQRLSAAVDAAALAGGRAFTADTTASGQSSAIAATVNRYFYANFPAGFLGTKNMSLPVIPPTDDPVTRVRTVKVTAGADVSLYFMPILGYGVTHISAVAQTSRRDINIMMVLDRSGSMGNACNPMKLNAQNFSDGFSNGNDTLGVVTFIATAKVDFPAGKDFKTRTPKNLVQTLSNLACNGSTNSSTALEAAYQEILKNRQPGTLDVIVFFTDGSPHGFTASLNFKSTTTCTSPDSTSLPFYLAGSPNRIQSALTAKTGLIQPISMAINSPTDTPGMTLNGCTVNSISALKNQFDGYPAQDQWGNPTAHYAKSTISDNGALATYTLTYNAAGKIDITVGNAWLISKSTAYSEAQKIRQDGVRIYTIGLGSNGGVDDVLLREIANDLTSDEYSPSQPTGRYAYAADPGQLSAAFNSIKSELLRLSQ